MYSIYSPPLFTRPTLPTLPPNLSSCTEPKHQSYLYLYKSKYANSPTINSIITPRLRLPLVLLLLILGEQAYWLAYSRMRE